ncbi:hypothetical protein SPLC1_S011640 [Arthrospira platensis C1]|nr:hypothetical protein SPLC1_S011640 [Arthrospira platensis C1]
MNVLNLPIKQIQDRIRPQDRILNKTDPIEAETPLADLEMVAETGGEMVAVMGIIALRSPLPG